MCEGGGGYFVLKMLLAGNQYILREVAWTEDIIFSQGVLVTGVVVCRGTVTCICNLHV